MDFHRYSSLRPEKPLFSETLAARQRQRVATKTRQAKSISFKKIKKMQKTLLIPPAQSLLPISCWVDMRGPGQGQVGMRASYQQGASFWAMFKHESAPLLQQGGSGGETRDSPFTRGSHLGMKPNTLLWSRNFLVHDLPSRLTPGSCPSCLPTPLHWLKHWRLEKKRVSEADRRLCNSPPSSCYTKYES